MVVNYGDLVDPDVDLTDSVQEAFGNNQDSLGIILVRGVPNYPTYRKRLLRLSAELVRLPKESLTKLEDPVSKYMFGWSHGKETMNGKQDLSKGSDLLIFVE